MLPPPPLIFLCCCLRCSFSASPPLADFSSSRQALPSLPSPSLLPSNFCKLKTKNKERLKGTGRKLGTTVQYSRFKVHLLVEKQTLCLEEKRPTSINQPCAAPTGPTGPGHVLYGHPLVGSSVPDPCRACCIVALWLVSTLLPTQYSVAFGCTTRAQVVCIVAPPPVDRLMCGN